MKRTPALLAALAVLLTVLFGLETSAGAKAKKHKAKKAKHPVAAVKHVPTCPGFGNLSSGVHALFDYHNPKSGLVHDVNLLICSAADNSTIDLKSWFVYDDGTYPAQTLYFLRFMHVYHHVTVNIVTSRGGVRASKAATAGLHLYGCPSACYGGTTDGRKVTHAKWITVSSLRAASGGGNAVLSTSMNFSTEQYAQGQSGLLDVRDRSLYAAFANRFGAYVRCAAGRGACSHAAPTGKWYGTGYAKVWFFPSQSDPDLYELQRAQTTCQHGGVIEVMSLSITRTSIVKQLQRDQAAGCRIYVLLEHAQPASETLHPRYEWNHDKAIIIDTPGLHEVTQGSQDLTPSEVLRWDNQMVRTTSTRVVNAYRGYFWYEYQRSRSRGY